MARIQHNDLTHYFMTPHEDLPASYLLSCNKFFKSLKLQAAGRARAASNKLQAREDIIYEENERLLDRSDKPQATGATKRTQLKGIK